MKKGIFITIEGPDGAGKSTQIRFIKDFFDKKGLEAIFTREPGGTDISEKIREIILDKENKLMDSKAEALLYAASRAQLVNQVIKPSLEKNKIVVCDRFVDSSVAYQGYGRGLGDGIKTINDWATDFLTPDMTVLLYVEPDTGRKRRNSRAEDRIELEKDDFHEKVFMGYMELAKNNKDRILAIDGNKKIDEIKKEIEGNLESVLTKHKIVQ